MSDIATVRINGINIGRFPLHCVKRITEANFKLVYMNVLSSKIQDIVSVVFSDMIKRVSVKTGGIETMLIDALKESISIGRQLYTPNGIGILSFDVLDSMLKIDGRNVGWWRVLESREDIIRNNNYMFISTKNKKPDKRTSPSKKNKFGEGFLISRSRFRGINFKPHTYSIKDKRYVTGFIRDLTKNTIDNEAFMDSVMRTTIITILCGGFDAKEGKNE